MGASSPPPAPSLIPCGAASNHTHAHTPMHTHKHTRTYPHLWWSLWPSPGLGNVQGARPEGTNFLLMFTTCWSVFQSLQWRSLYLNFLHEAFHFLSLIFLMSLSLSLSFSPHLLTQVLLGSPSQGPLCARSWLTAPLSPRPWSLETAVVGFCMTPSVVSGSPSRQSCSEQWLWGVAGPQPDLREAAAPGDFLALNPSFRASQDSDPPPTIHVWIFKWTKCSSFDVIKTRKIFEILTGFNLLK